MKVLVGRSYWWLCFVTISITLCFVNVSAEGTDLETTAEGDCYYNYNHYSEGDRILTNEPCLNCTCHNKMLMCYLKVCPFTKPIGQDCTIEKREDQCCPIITCPEVPVELDQSITQTTTDLATHQNYGCSLDGHFYPEGAQIPGNPKKPCELCYCIRNMTSCVMQECTLHVDGCRPIYNKGVCCPVRYDCAHDDEIPMIEDSQTTTEPPSQGFVITTTASPSQTAECLYNGVRFIDGELIKTDQPCEHCYCMRGDIVCAVQDCGRPLEMHGKNCTARLPKEGECCPQIYECENDIQSTSTISSATIFDENVHTSTQKSIERINDFDNSGKPIDQITEKIDESENEIHDKDYDHMTVKPSRNITAQQAVEDRIENHEYTTFVNELQGAVTVVEDFDNHDPSISTVIPINNKVVTDKKEDIADVTTESKGIFTELYTTIKSVVDYTTTLGSVPNNDDSHDILSSADGSLLSNVIPGEGDCLDNGITYSNNTKVPNRDMCEKACVCYNSIVHCEEIKCTIPPNVEKCVAFYDENQCCPKYECDDSEAIVTESFKIDEVESSATTLGQKLDSQTEPSKNDDSSAVIAETTLHPHVQSPISSKLDNTLETKPNETEADKIPTDSENETIEPETYQQSTSSPFSDEQISPEEIHTQMTDKEIVDTVETTTKSENLDKESEKLPEVPLETTEHLIESITSNDSLEDQDSIIGHDNSPDLTTPTVSATENDHNSKIEVAESHKIHPDGTTDQAKENEATTSKSEVNPSDDEQYTTQAYEKQHYEIESTQSNEKLPIETIFEQATSQKELQFDSMDGTTVSYGNEQNKEANVEKNGDDSMENEVLESTTHQPAQEESATEHRVEYEPAAPEHETMVSIPQENSQEEGKLPEIVEQDETLQVTTETNVNVDIKPENGIPSKHKDETQSSDHFTNQPQPTHQHTPPPVAIERDESITESFNQEMDSTYDSVVSSSSTEFTDAGTPNENIDAQQAEIDRETSTTTVLSTELEASTVFSSKIDSSGVDSNDFRDGEVVRPDEKGSIDVDTVFQTTESYKETTDKFVDKPQNPNLAQKLKPEVTTIFNEKSEFNTEVPSHSSVSIDEITTLHPTNKNPEQVSSVSTEASAERTTYIIPSKQEDLEIITEKIDASKQEDLNIITSTLSSEETTDQKDISSQFAQKNEQTQAEPASTVENLIELTTTQSIDYKQTEVPVSVDSESKQNSTIQHEPNLIENQTAYNEPGSQQNSIIEEEQPTTNNINSDISTENNKVSTEVEIPTTQTAHSQEIESQNQFVPNNGIPPSLVDSAATTVLAEPTTSVYNLNRIGDHEAEQEGFTTEKPNQESNVQNELQPSNEATGYDVTTLLNKIHDQVEITTLGKVESEITTVKPDETSKETSIHINNEQTESNVEHSHYDENQFDKKPSEGEATTINYDEHITDTTPTKLNTANDNLDNISKLEESSENAQSTEKIQEEIISTDKYTTSQSLVEESSTYSSANYPSVDLVPELPESIKTDDLSEVTTSRQQGINMIETQTNRVPIDQDNSASVNPNVTVQEINETTASPNNVPEEPIISHDEYPQENHSENIEDQTLTESTFVGTSTPKNVVELLSTLHPLPPQQFDSTSIESIETGSTESSASITTAQDKLESNEFPVLQPNNTIDQNINTEFSHNDENKTAEPITVASHTNVNVPPESTNNIPLIRDPLPDRFDEFTTKLAENFDTSTLPSILFSHTYSDSTTVKNTPIEITEPSSHIIEGPLSNQTEHDTELQSHVPSYAQPQAPYDNSATYPSQYPDEEYTDEEEPTAFSPGTCRYGGKLYVSAQQIPREDSCDFCFCFRSDIICLQQSCPPPIVGCREEPISGFCCPRYECPVPMALVINSTTTTTTTLPPYLSHFQRNSAKFTRSGCQVQGITYKIGERVTTASGPCIDCICGGDGQMKCDPKVCTPEPMLRQMIATATKRR